MILSLEDNKGARAVLLDTAAVGRSQTAPVTASSARIPTLYLGNAPGPDNELTLTVTMTADEIASVSAGASLQFDFPHLLADEDPVPPTAPAGWNVKPHKDARSGSTGWLITCDRAIATDQGPALRFCFKGLRGDPSSKPLGTLIVTPAAFAGLEDHRFGLRTAVALVDAPTGQDRALNIQATWAEKVGRQGMVVTTRDGQQPQVANRLAFALLNPTDGPVVAPELAWLDRGRPTFSVHFIYASERPGRGALCTEQVALARAPTLRTASGEVPWTCTLQHSLSSGPCWTVQPEDGNHALLAAHDTLELVFEDVVCDLGTDAQGDVDVTQMVVLWADIPGCMNDSLCLPVLKIDELRVLELISDPPTGKPVGWGSKARLSWRTLGAENSHLLDSRFPDAITEMVGDGPHQVEVVLDQVDLDRRFQVFAYRGSVEKRSDSLSFAAIDYPALRFTQPLSVTPAAGLTRVIPGITREGRPVVAPVPDLTLHWALEFPQLVKGYTLKLNGQLWKSFDGSDFPLVDGLHEWRIDLRDQDQRTAREFAFELLVHALIGETHDVSAAVTFVLVDPIDRLQLEVVPMETLGVEMDWGLLLYNAGDICRCEFRISSDPALKGANWWAIQFADGGNPGNWQCVLSEISGNKTKWQRDLGSSVNVTALALGVASKAGDFATFPYRGEDGIWGAVKSLDVYLIGLRLTWPAATTSVSIPGDPYPMGVKPFTLVVTKGLKLLFEGEQQPFQVYHNEHTDYLVWSDDDKVADPTKALAFDAIDTTGFPSLSACGRVEFTRYDGTAAAHSMSLTIELGQTIRAYLTFQGGGVRSEYVALTVVPPG